MDLTVVDYSPERHISTTAPSEARYSMTSSRNQHQNFRSIKLSPIAKISQSIDVGSDRHEFQMSSSRVASDLLKNKPCFHGDALGRIEVSEILHEI